MNVRILRPALEDLAAGRQFYDPQRAGAGEYFFNSLFSEIDSLVLYAGIHRTHLGYHRLLALSPAANGLPGSGPAAASSARPCPLPL